MAMSLNPPPPPVRDREQATRLVEQVLRDAGPYPFRYKAWAERIVDALLPQPDPTSPVQVTDEMAAKAAEAAWQAWPDTLEDPPWTALQTVVRAALDAALTPA